MAKIAFLDGTNNETALDGMSRATTQYIANSGVLRSGDLAVTESDTPGASVKVAAGRALIGFDDTALEDKYYVFFQDAAATVTITANASGNDRIDAIVAYVDTSSPASDDNDGAGVLVAIEGTPAGSPSAPSDGNIDTELGAGVRWIRLADVEVANGFSSILDADITDQRDTSGYLIGKIVDENGDIVTTFNADGTAVNYISISNAATGNGATIESAGGDTNVDLVLATKGSGVIDINDVVDIDAGVTINNAQTSGDAVKVEVDATSGTPGGLHIQATDSGIDGNAPLLKVTDNAGTNLLRLEEQGYFGLGVLDPITYFDLRATYAGGAIAQIFNEDTTDSSTDGLTIRLGVAAMGGANELIKFRDGDNNVVGSINSEVTYSTFTGSHWSQLAYEEEYDAVEVGMILCSTGKILGTPNVSQALPETEIAKEARAKNVYGVFTEILPEKYDDEIVDGKKVQKRQKVKHMDDDRAVIQLNALGEGLILVTNENGEVTNGDYITTSSTAGYGMKQDDDLLHSYTVAKVTEDVDFSEGTHKVGKYKAKLVACTYHCG